MDVKRVEECEILEFLPKILADEKITNYDIEFAHKSEKGDGYMGDIIFAVIREKAGAARTHNLVIKCEKRSEELRKIMPVREAFANEMIVYREILPAFARFEDGKRCCRRRRRRRRLFACYPRCYATLVHNDMQIVVLEDLKVYGYTMWDSRKPLDYGHIMLVVRELGRLHALSLAFKIEHPHEFGQLAKNVDVFKKIHKPGNTVYRKISHSIYDYLIANGEFIILEKIAVLYDDFIQNLNDIGDVQDPLSVFVHGDCWINNFLFKYDDNNRATNVAMLDWQLSRIASPVTDLSFFLFSSCSDNELKYFDEFLMAYHDNLTKSLNELGLNAAAAAADIISWPTFLTEWNKYAKFGILMMPILLTFCLCTKNEAIDSYEVVDKDTKIEDELFENLQANKAQYFKRVYDVLKFFINRQTN